jgi:CheY-like chemotaxis protein
MARDDDRNQKAGLGWLRNKRVLLAEDNVTNQMVATQMLDALGARVDVANDGAEALEMIEQRSYDIYLIDIEMPRVSGLDVIRHIRNAPPPLCESPVIAVTAYALREHREKIAEAGADGLIPKPLIGIDQFGRDILNFTDRARRRAGPSAASPGPAPAAEAAEERPLDVCPVSMPVFTALADAIGPEAMADLLLKIDGDLDKAGRDVAVAMAAGDMAAVGAGTHVLVSVAGAIGAQNLQRLSQKLGALAAGRAEGDAPAVAADLGVQIMVLRAFVKARVGAIAG